ncbi:glycosyltransferase, partial [Candidatus Peregrinibacteria bacterium]|nr:glycosyltransferase [Candidatus Peregrinibacteria bacterium]
VPLESMACGTPVIAFRSGGAIETVQENVTGEFFGEQTAASLAETLQHFDRSHFSENTCHTHVRKFSREVFERGIREAVEELIL